MRTWRKVALAALVSSVCWGPLAALAETVTYTYDARGRLKTATYSTGPIVTYSYDAAGNRTQLVITGGTGGTNTAPDAVDDYEDANAYYAGGGWVYPSFTAYPLTNDTDADSDTLTITGVTQPSNGTVTFTSTSVNYDHGTPYQPTGMDAELVDFDTFTYTISDGNGGTDTATVNVNIVVW
jgi:YD repeat-containing protein